MDWSSKIVKDFCTRESENRLNGKETITFHYGEPKVFQKEDYDWYIVVAVEKADKVTVDRTKLTGELILSYRWAIREGFQHGLDPQLKNRFDYPRNKNTVAGIQGYIDRIKKLSEEEIKNILGDE